MEVGRVYRMALSLTLTALLAAVAVTGAWAVDGKPKLVLNISTEKEVVTLKDGREVVERVPSDKAKPGEVLVYTISYENTGDGEAKNASIVDPVPENTVYVIGSAEGEGTEITCSIDDGKTYHKEPVRHLVKKPDGTTEQRDADPEMYTHIRWMVKSVPTGGSGEITFKVKLE